MERQNTLQGYLVDENASKQFAIGFAKALVELTTEMHALPDKPSTKGWVIFLEGDLGAGKSYFSRALIQTFLPKQKVKSPTYTLVESYPVPLGDINHFDLYRLCDPEELGFLGARDLFADGFLSLIEWPSKGQGELPKPDLEIAFSYHEMSRDFKVTCYSERAVELVKKLS